MTRPKKRWSKWSKQPFFKWSFIHLQTLRPPPCQNHFPDLCSTLPRCCSLTLSLQWEQQQPPCRRPAVFTLHAACLLLLPLMASAFMGRIIIPFDLQKYLQVRLQWRLSKAIEWWLEMVTFQLQSFFFSLSHSNNSCSFYLNGRFALVMCSFTAVWSVQPSGIICQGW